MMRRERYLPGPGARLAKNPALRSEVVIATKISGFNPGSETAGARYVPAKASADCRLDAASIKMSCDASLRRLQTVGTDG